VYAQEALRLLSEHEGAQQLQIVSRAMKTHRPVFVDGAARRAPPPQSHGVYCEPDSWAEFTELVGKAAHVRTLLCRALQGTVPAAAGPVPCTMGVPWHHRSCHCVRQASARTLSAFAVLGATKYFSRLAPFW
jgi:hypothetical protein